MSSSTHAAVAAADSSSPKRAELAVSAAGGGGGANARAAAAAAAAKPRGSSYDADELNEIRNLSLGNDEGAAAGAGFKRGRRGSGGRKFEKERVTLLFIF